MHPRHKLEYFQAAGWSQEWIDIAHQIVRDTFDISYANHDVPHGTADEDLDADHSEAELPVSNIVAFLLIVSSRFCVARTLRIYLTDSPLSLSQKQTTLTTNWMHTLPLMSKTFLMPLNGGMINTQIILVSHAWRLIICQFLVCHTFGQVCTLISYLTSYIC